MTSCPTPASPEVEFGNPHVLGANGKPTRVPEDEEVKIEETEIVDNEEPKAIENQDDEMVELVANQTLAINAIEWSAFLLDLVSLSTVVHQLFPTVYISRPLSCLFCALVCLCTVSLCALCLLCT